MFLLEDVRPLLNHYQGVAHTNNPNTSEHVLNCTEGSGVQSGKQAALSSASNYICMENKKEKKGLVGPSSDR